MKKHLKSSRKAAYSLVALATAAISPGTFADTLGFYAGGGIWQANFEGDIGVSTPPATLDELGIGNSQNNYFFFALEHPVPIIPNLRIVSTSLNTDGSATITREISFDSLDVPVNADTNSELDLSHTDYTVYWEVMDNYLSLDLGFTARDFDGYASIDYVVAATETTPEETGSEREELDATLPMLYTKVQLDLPITGWFVGGSANYVSYEGNSISDLEAKIGYLTEGLGLDVGFDLGYRQMTVEADDDENVKADLNVNGAFASFIVHF